MSYAFSRPMLLSTVVISFAAVAVSQTASAAGVYFFEPAGGANRTGILGLSNTGATAATVTITARDDHGQAAPGGAVTVSLAAGERKLLSSDQLENGVTGVTGRLGDGQGYWHLSVTATSQVAVQNFAQVLGGGIAEVSTALSAQSDGTIPVYYFAPPGTASFETRLRLVNTGSSAATVAITAVDGTGAAVTGSASVQLAANSAIEVSASDLTSGNAARGVTGALTAGASSWRLALRPMAGVTAYAVAQTTSGELANLSTAVAVVNAAASDACPSGKFLAVTADPRNSAYAAPTLSVSCDGATVTVNSNGIPNFEFVQTTPNRLQVQTNVYRFPQKPSPAATKADVPLGGAAAVAVNGLPIFGPTEAPQDGYRDPIRDELLDYCNGHTAQRGDYHFHARPECLFTDMSGRTSLVLGYAFDGYPILAPWECADSSCTKVEKMTSSWRYIGGSTAAWQSNKYVEGLGTLDKCNGRTRPDGSYAYYATDGFPYILGCYHGTPTSQIATTGGTAGGQGPGVQMPGGQMPGGRPPIGP